MNSLSNGMYFMSQLMGYTIGSTDPDIFLPLSGNKIVYLYKARSLDIFLCSANLPGSRRKMRKEKNWICLLVSCYLRLVQICQKSTGCLRHRKKLEKWFHWIYLQSITFSISFNAVSISSLKRKSLPVVVHNPSIFPSVKLEKWFHWIYM